MKVIVIGAGASGMMAAYAAGASGCETVLIEKNEKAGKKIYITGKGRCNVTNACDIDVFIRNITNGSKFMYSSLKAFGPGDMCAFLTENGCRLKTERGGRVFPVTDHASDVTRALLRALSEKGIDIRYNTEVTDVSKAGGSFLISCVTGGRKIAMGADRVIICTGGLSYPSTGSTGDGYMFAKSFGHSVSELFPSLVSVLTKEDTSKLAGISLRNIGLSIYKKGALGKEGKALYDGLGELVFTHRGISGPLVLAASSLLSGRLSDGEGYVFSVDLKPGLSYEMLKRRLIRDFEGSKNACAVNALSGLIINGIRGEVLWRSGIAPDKKVHDLKKAEREAIARTVKAFEFTSCGTGGFSEAVVTKGGVSLKEIDPKTMESKLVPGLFFAGEVLDTDALTGGFNLQTAWSTGAAAGNGASGRRNGSK